MVRARTIAASAAAGFAGLLAATASAGATTVHLDSHVMTAGVGDILLGASAASVVMAGMIAVIAVSWRSFREAADGRRDPFDWRDGPRD